VDPDDRRGHRRVAVGARRGRTRLTGAVRIRGDLDAGFPQRRADRLDPELTSVLVDVIVD
jgi:hypothetical protein